MGKDITILHTKLPTKLFLKLEKMKQGRSWKGLLAEIQDDARKAAERNKFLSDQVEFYKREIEVLKKRLRELPE